jgi:hypothetical protein
MVNVHVSCCSEDATSDRSVEPIPKRGKSSAPERKESGQDAEEAEMEEPRKTLHA